MAAWTPPTFTDKTDHVDKVTAAAWKQITDAIAQLYTELGADPKGAAASVTARLAAVQPLHATLTALAALTTAEFGRDLLTVEDLDELLELLGDGTGPAEGEFLGADGWASLPGGGDMLASNNLGDLTDPVAARANLGLADEALEAFGTGAVDAHVEEEDPHAQYQLVAGKGEPDGYAPLDGDGIIPVEHFPAGIGGGSTYPVADESAMVALTMAVVGDVAVRADEGNARYMLLDPDYSDAESWQVLNDAAGPVQSVDGQTGIVSLGSVYAAKSVETTKLDKDSGALTGTPTAPTPGAGDNSTRIATTAFVKMNTFGGLGGIVDLDSFTGASDDAKFSAARSYAAAQTFKPVIYIGRTGGLVTFTTPFEPYRGFRIGGPPFGNEQVRSGDPYPVKVRLAITGGGAWMQVPNETVNAGSIENLAFDMASTTDFATTAGSSSVVAEWLFHQLTFNAGRRVMGSPSKQFVMRACTLDGRWNTNNMRDTAYTLAGSDNALWVGAQSLFDTPPANMGSNKYLLRFAFLSKSVIGPIYMTCETHSGILITGQTEGSSGGYGLVFQPGGVIEGRNRGAPCLGALVRVEGGEAYLDGWNFGFAMTNAAGGDNSDDAGVIHVDGSNASVTVNGCAYNRANGVAYTVPFLACQAGKARVTNMRTQASHTDNTWSTNKPVVDASGSGTVSGDDTVSLT